MARRLDIDQVVRHIVRYGSREPWLARHREHVSRMLGSLPERYGLEPGELFAEVEALGQSAALIGYLDEAFLAAEFGAERGNVTDEYLKRRAWQETPRAREYLQGLRSTPPSLYEVHAVAPGEWLELRDRLRDGPPRRIHEQSGSRHLQRWDLIVARIVEPRGEAMLTGGVLALTRDAGEAVESIVRRARTKGGRAAAALARKLGADAGALVTVNGELDEPVLRSAEHAFLQIWLKSLLDLARRKPPALQNTDGEALLLGRTRFRISPSTAAEIAGRFDALADWAREQDDSPAWLWLSGPEDDRPTIRAWARIEGGALVVEANSRERMEHVVAAVRTALGALVADGITTYEDPARVLELSASRQAGPPSDPVPQTPELEAALRQVKDQHYRRTLDEPVPMLGNKTPRACARSKQGRTKLVAWLKELENRELRQAAATGAAPYETAWMWRELGVRPD